MSNYASFDRELEFVGQLLGQLDESLFLVFDFLSELFLEGFAYIVSEVYPSFEVAVMDSNVELKILALAAS